MSTEGLPVNNVVGTNVELGPRSAADAANAASSSQSADSAAASADRAWKFSNDAAASATAAQNSANSAATAMSNALSKVTTAEQTVASAVKFNGGITSLGDCVLQSKTPGANVIIRFKDNDAVEQGAIYNTVATGQMTLRWGGTAYSLLLKPDGTATFPGKVFTGTARLLNEATQLSATDLNTVRDEGTYFQNATSNATPANNYPAGLAGTLEVFNSHAQASGRTGVTQFYYPWNVGNYYYGRVYLALSDTWSDWDIYEARAKADARYVKIGDYGIGSTGMGLANATTGFIAQASSSGLAPTNGAGFQSVYAANRRAQLFIGTDGKVISRFSTSDVTATDVTAWNTHYTTANTTVDSNGFIKKASPIVKLFGDGTSELNEQSLGVTTERIGQGVYRVSGVLGFNGDGAWGGHGNGIEIPVDDNKRALIWVESKVLPDADIEVRTYHRTYDTGPYSARNIEAMDSGEVDKKKQPIFVEMPDGTPIDIPDSRFIDLRVEIPAGDEPEYIPEPEPEVILEPEQPEVSEPEGGEEQAPSETPAPIE